MERSAYALLHAMEKSWWYAGRRKAVAAAAAHAGVSKTKQERALDFGAGYGGMYAALAELSTRVDAYEPDKDACEVAKTRGYGTIYNDRDTALSHRYGYIGVFDVLEHIQDDADFLERACGALTDNGRILITVPAFPWLWSEHDTEHHHFRRYTKKSLTKVLVDNGYFIDYISYWNCALLLPAAAIRWLGRSGGEGLTPPKFVNAILTALVSIEASILRFVPLPFGVSLVAVAHKAGSKAVSTATSTAGTTGSNTMQRFWQLMRYGITGIIGGLIQVFTLFVWISLLHLQRVYVGGVILGFCIALTVTFVLQKYWTFRERAARPFRVQFPLYTGVALFGLLLTTVLLDVAKSLFESHGVSFFAGWYLLAQIVIVGIVSLVNFCLNALITFKQRP